MSVPPAVAPTCAARVGFRTWRGTIGRKQDEGVELHSHWAIAQAPRFFARSTEAAQGIKSRTRSSTTSAHILSFVFHAANSETAVCHVHFASAIPL